MVVVKKPILIGTLDTETRGLFGQAFLMGLYLNGKYTESETFKLIDNELIKYADKYDIHIYIHNADFDIAKFVSKMDRKINFSNSIFINQRICVLNTDAYTFHDSYALLKSSLEQLCKDFNLTDEESKYNLEDYLKNSEFACYINNEFNLKKSKENYFLNVSPKDKTLRHYLKMDCKSLFKLISILIKLSGISLERFVRCPTTPSLAMAVFKEKYPDDYEKICSSKFYGEIGELAEDFLRESYKGGRAEVFTPYIEAGFHYDRISSYPAIAEEMELPYGKYEYFSEPMKAAQIFQYWQKRKFGIGFLKCKVFVPDMYLPPLPHRICGKLLFPTGYLTDVWTFDELQLALDEGCEIKDFYECVYFQNTAPLLRGFMGEFRVLKQTCEGSKRQFAKSMMNNITGKFGMKRARSGFVDISEREELDQEGASYFIHEYNNNDFKLQFIEKVIETNASYIQPQVISYITSQGRIALYKALKHTSENGILCYCDTDSDAGSVRLPDEMCDSKEFGKWKLEGTLEKGIFLQPKFYCEVSKEQGFIPKGKGIPIEILTGFNYQNYTDILESFKNSQENGTNEKIKVDSVLTREKFLTALKNNDSMDKKIIYQKSINTGLMQKRDIDYINNVSKPYYIDDDNMMETKYASMIFERNQKINDFDFDNDMFENLMEHTKIRTPKKSEKFYEVYNKLTKQDKARYFSRTGENVQSILNQLGWSMNDLILILI